MHKGGMMVFVHNRGQCLITKGLLLPNSAELGTTCIGWKPPPFHTRKPKWQGKNTVSEAEG